MSGGVLLALAGVWVLAQVLGGNALGRLGISGEASQPGTTKSATAAPNTAWASGSRPMPARVG